MESDIVTVGKGPVQLAEPQGAETIGFYAGDREVLRLERDHAIVYGKRVDGEKAEKVFQAMHDWLQGVSQARPCSCKATVPIDNVGKPV